MAVAAAVALAVISFAGSTEAARKQKSAANKEADQLQRESRIQAGFSEERTEKLKGIQRSRFLSSGVRLEGSPLLVLEETRSRGAAEAKNIIESGTARAQSIRRRASAQFQGQLFQGIGQLATSVVGAGAFGGAPAAGAAAGGGGGRRTTTATGGPNAGAGQFSGFQVV